MTFGREICQASRQARMHVHAGAGASLECGVTSGSRFTAGVTQPIRMIRSTN